MAEKETLRNLSRKKRQAANKLALAIFRHIKPIMSHEEVAAKMGISRRRVRQIEASALRKLTERMRQACPERCIIPADESNDDFAEAGCGRWGRSAVGNAQEDGEGQDGFGRCGAD